MRHQFLRMALVLGLLSAVGPFAIDMYLPALPAIGASLNADVHAVQASLMAFFLSFALAQLVFGPASDILGRKPPLYAGLALFVVGSVGCAWAPDIGWLVAFRVLQGVGGAAPGVVTRAVVRDLHTGNEATRLMSLLMLVFSISPILAPLFGSFLIDAFGWRGIFWAVGATGIAGLLLVAFALEETRPMAERHSSDIASTLRAFALLLRDARFMGLTAAGGFGMAAFFIYLANSSFVLIERYGLTPRQYSLAFAVNAVSFIGVSQLAGRLVDRWGLPRVVGAAVTGFAFAMCALLVVNLAGAQQLGVMIPLLLVGFGFLGLVVPTTSVMALDDHGDIAGAAAALMGTLQMVLGSLVMAMMGLFADGGARPMVAGIAVTAVITFGVTRLTLRAHHGTVSVLGES